jgi:glyoxylase-like metal-dependent hydrolase (beta-lactamase superfamily II)
MIPVIPDLYCLDLRMVNVYLWTGPGGPSLIDTGLPGTVTKLLAALRRQGVEPADLQRILITHGDLDHIGGLKALKQLSPARVCCHAAEVPFVRDGALKPVGPGLMGLLTRPGFLLLHRLYRPGVARVEEIVIEGHVTPEGFTVLHTPGHSPGHMALWHQARGILIAGDALNNRGGRLHLPPDIATPKPAMARESLVKLSKLTYEVACFGHGPPIVGGAATAVATFVQGL